MTARTAAALLLGSAALAAVPVQLPFPAGVPARCIQGPHGERGRSHADYHAWDFAVAGGTWFTAAAAGRVVHVVDDRTTTGANAFSLANRILVDHGRGRYAQYLHHAPGTARVRVGERVTLGQPLARVGSTGTEHPHLHFDLRGPDWRRTHAVEFVADRNEPQAVHEGDAVARSHDWEHPPAFTDSRLQGDAFAACGVRIDTGGPAFRIQAEIPRTIRGAAPDADEVGWFLWQDGERSEYAAVTDVQPDGSFTLEVEVPASSRGSRWYRVTSRRAGQEWRECATLPVGVE